MDIGQILANGSIVTVLGGILYGLQERRLKQIESKNQQLDDQKVTKEMCVEKHSTQILVNDEFKETLKEGHEIMSDLKTTTALLSERVMTLFKEIEKQNNGNNKKPV